MRGCFVTPSDVTTVADRPRMATTSTAQTLPKKSPKNASRPQTSQPTRAIDPATAATVESSRRP
jgi:hypothetical protein